MTKKKKTNHFPMFLLLAASAVTEFVKFVQTQPITKRKMKTLGRTKVKRESNNLQKSLPATKKKKARVAKR